MIAHATFELFKRHNIDYRLFNWRKFDSRQKTIVYGGGGSLIPLYGLAQAIIKKLHPDAQRLIILPHTITANEEFLRELGTNVDVICRDEISYDHVEKYADKARVMIGDDLAFHLDANTVLKTRRPGTLKTLLLRSLFDLLKSKRRDKFPPVRKMIEAKKLEIGNCLRRLSNPETYTGQLHAFREDDERTPYLFSPRNIDVSEIFGFGTRNETIALYATGEFLDFINQFREVITNRLHVCIGAALLGKNVQFFPNNYYKCEAVYNYSMKNRFHNVEWMG